MEENPDGTLPEIAKSTTPTEVRAEVGPIPAASWECPGCRATAVSIQPKMVVPLAQGRPVRVKCQCGMDLMIKQSVIHQISKKPVVKRKPIIVT